MGAEAYESSASEGALWNEESAATHIRTLFKRESR